MVENILRGLQDATEYREEHFAVNEPRNGMESEERSVLKELHNTSEYNGERPQKEKEVRFCDTVR